MKSKPYLTVKQVTNNNVFIDRNKTKDFVFPLHWHDFFELEIVVSGTGTQIFNGKEYPIRSGTVIFSTPSDQHEIHTKTTTEIIVVQFDEHAIEKDSIDTFITSNEHFFYIDDKNTFELIVKLAEYLKNCSSKCVAKIFSTIFTLLEPQKTNIVHSLKPHYTIQQAVVYLHSHFKESPRLKDVASLFYMNQNYFCSLFKEATGKNYKEYLLELKLNYAKQLLNNTDWKVSRIASECGYSSHSLFTSEFKKHTSISPAQYRNQKIQNYSSNTSKEENL